MRAQSALEQKDLPYLNKGTNTTYLNQVGAKLPYTLKNLKNAYISMKLTQNEVIQMKFWN